MWLGMILVTRCTFDSTIFPGLHDFVSFVSLDDRFLGSGGSGNVLFSSSSGPGASSFFLRKRVPSVR